MRGRLLQELHERYIAQAERPMTFGALPVQPLQAEALPIVPTERWREAGDALHKTYRFRRSSDRDDFIVGLLAHERAVGHGAAIFIDSGTVSLRLTTGDAGHVTELDKEYAAYADVLHRELVYSSNDADEG